MVNTGTGAQLQPRLHHTPSTAALNGGGPQTHLAKEVLYTVYTPSVLGWGWDKALLPAREPSPIPSSPSITTRHHCPLATLLPCLICVFVLSISFSSFPSTAPWTWAPEENFPALVTDAHSGTERLEHSSDQKML